MQYVVWVLLALIAVITARAEENAEQASLQNIEQIEVAVAINPATADRLTLPSNRLKTAMELQLRKNGIPLKSDAGRPTLLVTVIQPSGQINKVEAVAVVFEFFQPVVVRANDKRIRAITWQRAVVIMASPISDLRSAVMDGIDEAADMFSNDYLAAQKNGAEPSQK